MAQPGGSPATSGETFGTGLYAASDLFMLRAPVLAADTFANLGAGAPAPVPSQAPASGAALADARAEGRATLRRLATLPRVRQAIHVASPSLDAALSGHGGTPRQESALLRYLIRMSTRPTPRGLFAGVATGTFQEGRHGAGIATLDVDPVRTTRTKADSVWLDKVFEQIERDRSIRDGLRVEVNALVHRMGTMAVLTTLRRPGGPRPPERIEVPLTGPASAALELAEDTPTFGELVDRLAHRFPATPQERVRRLLDRLWDLGILRTDLFPPLTLPLPEIQLAKRLIGQGVHTGTVDRLTRVRQLADEVDRSAGHADPACTKELQAQQRAMVPGLTHTMVQLDTALAVRPDTLPAEIAAAAADAAELSMRLGVSRQRWPHIVGYHEAFLERYGIDAEVPLREVLSPETGLGPPNGYYQPERQQPLPEGRKEAPSDRDRVLVGLAVEAARDGRFEVELDDALVERLTLWRPDEAHSRPRTAQDLFFQLAAASPEAIRDGRWRLVLNTTGNFSGWHGFGRFFDLLDETVVARIRDQQRREEALRPDTVFAELNYRVPGLRGTNLASHPPVRDYEVCVNAAPSGPPVRQIALDDIVLGADAERFYLRSHSLGRNLVVGQTHALNPVTAPNICRALLEFSADGYTPLCTFEWGAAAEAPFLPRLTRGSTVVHPARWTISAATFDDHDDPDDFYRACRRWRQKWQVPRYTQLVDEELLLLLDLDHPLWVDELHRQVRRLHKARPGSNDSTIHLLEALPGPDDLWLRDRAGRRYHAELAVPLVLQNRTRMPEPASPRTAEPPPVTRRWLPGDEWTHLKLYAATELHDALITGPLQALLADERFGALVDRWFFIRYADPLPHLRLRFHSRDCERAAESMSRCANWARDLVRGGRATDFVFCAYDREVERYGGGHAIDQVERAFCANSEAAAELVRLQHVRGADLEADVVCVAALHELYRSWGGNLQPSGRRQIPDKARPRFRELKSLLCELIAPGEHRPDPRAPHYRAALEPVFAGQRQALADAGRHVRDLAGDGLLTGNEENVIESLAHIQSIRLVGIDRDRERMSRALWLLSLRAIQGRPASVPADGGRR